MQINDLPKFLSGDEQRDTQHIAITHVTSEPQRRRSLRRNRHRSPRGSLVDLGDRSNNSTPMGYASSLDGSEDIGYFTQSTASLPRSRPTSRGSMGSQRELGGRGNLPKKKKKGPHHPHQPPINEAWEEDSILRSLKEEIEENMLEDIEDDRSVAGSQHLPRSRHALGGLQHSMRSNAPSMRSTDSLNTSQASVRPLPPHPEKGAFEKVVATDSKVKADQTGVIVKEEAAPKQSGCFCAPFFCRGGGKSQVAPICKNESAADTAKFTSKVENLQ